MCGPGKTEESTHRRRNTGVVFIYDHDTMTMSDALVLGLFVEKKCLIGESPRKIVVFYLFLYMIFRSLCQTSLSRWKF